ncbi:MAG: response regulator transcription factor, partial [Thiobacillus sp.]|nr:response regulator transcription factor [Thiobacillus sp.]
MPTPLNIILIDDHPLLRMGVAGYIQQEPDLTLTAQLANAAELRAWLAAGNRADAALLDRSLPDADGLDLVSDLRDLGIKVIMLTIADSDEEISEAISSGVDGYVIKSSEPDQVLAAIRSVCDGQSSFPLNIMQKMARGELNNNALSALTAREIEIVDHVKEGLSNNAIANKMTLS